MTITLIRGDCTVELANLPADSFDSCVCDPPYHLTSVVKRFGGANAAPAQYGTDGAYTRASTGFMGKIWDGGDVAFRPETWAEVYRVLKPGAFLLAMAGTRTYHRMTCAIEDAGFEIRDSICWLYASGFPKSHDVSKGIDRAAGQRGGNVPSGAAVRRMIPGADQDRTGSWVKDNGRVFQPGEYAPATLEAAYWQGWGTALKPACELVAVSRKPLSEGTVANNMRWHGTGALNIDASRVGTDPKVDDPRLGGKGTWATDKMAKNAFGEFVGTEVGSSTLGRWPSNVIHDGSDEVLAAFAVSGTRTSGKPGSSIRNSEGFSGIGGSGLKQAIPLTGFGDSGSAARFYYSAKATKGDRAGSSHPTVKPVALIRYLVRLVTQPGGNVLDPFAGSGTTAAAAQAEGMDATLIEMEGEYEDDIRLRLGRGSLTGVVRRNEQARKRLEAALGRG